MSQAEVHAHSAVHVLKGAVIKVLGARLTTSVHTGPGKGTLTVQSDRKPSPEEISRIASEANQKVYENVEVVTFEMERDEAEGHFGNRIYDLFPVPEGVRLLKIVRINDWEVNCCKEAHVDATGEIGRIRVGGARYRESKKVLELDFTVG